MATQKNLASKECLNNMAYSTAGQMLVFLAYIFFGIVASLLFHLISKINFKANLRFLSFVLEGAFGAIMLVLLWIFNLKLNFGQFRLFIVLGFALGIFVYRKICWSVVDKLSAKLYNLFASKFAGRLKNEDNIQK